MINTMLIIKSVKIPEKLNFSSKLKKFEEEISNQNQLKKAPLNGLSNGLKSGIPTKKPLVSQQDFEKIKAEEANKNFENAKNMEDNEAEDAVLELSNDACFNQLLRQG